MVELSEQELVSLAKKSGYAYGHIKKMWKNFRELDVHQEGAVRLTVFTEATGLQNLPISFFVAHLFNDEENELNDMGTTEYTISFEKMVKIMGIFRKKNDEQEKLKTLFNMYVDPDSNHNGLS